ncbi:nitrite reductase large subunit NirB [Paenibacillus tuaregi]|uniref:nitrite reductase large subunit NirB n=1 Tax=Paenibacillus tuaregi TaxID=1816681 RepID=UPI0008389059|nr:nitrite reductase large subunit NirB [Paenibacillus tuaregi]
MTKRKLVLIGNGMAGVRCVEEILKLAPGQFEITIFGKEPHPNYNRIMLSKVLQGDTKIEDITINDWQWYRNNGIRLLSGETVCRIDTNRKQVVSESGITADYDDLIIATGSLPFMLPLPGADKPGVTAFRDINDCNKMMETAKSYKKAVVIGGGLLGLEAARGLLNLGMEVSVVHIYHHLMERQLDPTAAEMLRKELESQGMRFFLEKHTERILGKKRVEGLQFKDGSKVAADLVVIAVGVRPNVKLAADSGIKTNRAIVVNDYMETNVSNVYAVGECAEHRGMVYGLVAPLYEQGKVLASRICGIEMEGYHGSILYSQLKVSGVEVFSAGEIRDSDVSTSLKAYDGIRGTYKKVTVKDGKIAGAVLFGDSSEGNKLLGYIKQQADVSVLEEAAAGTVAGTGADEAYVCAMADKETICSCNGVPKGTIVEAIREKELQTFEEVRACTRASSTCGGCKPLVSALLKVTLERADEAEPAKKTVCACTTLSHAEVKVAVVSGAYVSARDAMNGLGWLSEEGCPVCRAALRYYIGAQLTRVRGGAAGTWQASSGEMPPLVECGVSGSRLQTGEASFAGAAAHSADGGAPPASRGRELAMIRPLAEGGCAVTPRMFGGVTTADQLRRIADAIDAFGIPLAKLSGGAQLDLLGVAPEQVQAVTAALGGAAAGASYGWPMAAVATCAGAYDRGALQDSISLGAQLERRLEGLQLPTAVSVGVSASPLHRAGTLAKDVGLSGAPGGWDLYAGGSGGAQLKQGQLLLASLDSEEALDLASALLQLYREEADFGEPTGQWVDRIGLVQLRELLLDRDNRSALLHRLEQERGTTILSTAAGCLYKVIS